MRVLLLLRSLSARRPTDLSAGAEPDSIMWAQSEAAFRYTLGQGPSLASSIAGAHRATMTGHAGVPGGGGERAIYSAQETRYKDKKNGKQPKAQNTEAADDPWPIDPAAVLASRRRNLL